MAIENEGHRLRLKQRFIAEGLDNFEPHNILELLLFYSVPRRDTNPIAHRLINEFGGLSEVLNARPEELMKIDGVTENTAVLLSMMPQLFRAYSKDAADSGKIAGMDEIERYVFSRFQGLTTERVMLVSLDNRMRMLSCDTVGEGSVSFSVVDKRRIIEILLRHNATAAVIAHNHPRGFAIPSSEDIATTADICKMLGGIGIRLKDHLIVCPDDYVSLAQSRQFSGVFRDSGRVDSIAADDPIYN